MFGWIIFTKRSKFHLVSDLYEIHLYSTLHAKNQDDFSQDLFLHVTFQNFIWRCYQFSKLLFCSSFFCNSVFLFIQTQHIPFQFVNVLPSIAKNNDMVTGNNNSFPWNVLIFLGKSVTKNLLIFLLKWCIVNHAN